MTPEMSEGERAARLAALPAQARETLAQVPGERVSGLLARLRGAGATDPREILVALYLDCTDRARAGCLVQHQVLLSASGVELLDWALTSPRLVGTVLPLTREERALVEAAGGTDWHIARAWRASSSELLP